MGANLEAEAHALLEGVTMCVSLSQSQVFVEMDSKVLLEVITRNASCSWRIDYIIRQIWSTSQDGWFPFSYGYREVSSVADALAQIASTNRAYCTYHSINLPRHVKGIVNLDRFLFPYLHVS